MSVITVWGIACPKGSFRAITRPSGGVYLQPTSNGERSWREAIAWAARAARIPLIKKPQAVKMTLEFFFVRPESHTRAAKKGKAPPPRPSIAPPDLDKLQRSVLDALSGIAYDDDRQVVSITASKFYADRPHARICVVEELS